MIQPVEYRVIEANELTEKDARRLGVLLGRAYTDDRHLRAYSADDLARWSADVERVHASPPVPGELMPGDYMTRFPTWRNAARPRGERREALHFVSERDGYFAAHVSLWAQVFVFDDVGLPGGYIEDVATDPLALGERLAMDAMKVAETRARELGLALLGLATGLRGYYERLGWLPWPGDHLHHTAGREGSHLDQPLYLLPLSPEGEAVTAASGMMKSWRMTRFGERLERTQQT